MWSRVTFIINRLSERLWVRPLVFCALSITGAFIAKAADSLEFGDSLPAISQDSIGALLSVTAASMLVIATLAVASMVSAYASAASGATPRSFSLLVSDDLSQNALSTFMGAFIYSIVALVTLKNDYYQQAGHFLLFSITVLVLALVVVTFVRWVDWIARLGRIGSTIDKVEAAAAAALQRRRLHPALGATPVTALDTGGVPIYAKEIGYLQHINIDALQTQASECDFTIDVGVLPGTFVSPGCVLAYIHGRKESTDLDADVIRKAFHVGKNRVYDDDPRFGLIALSEIASRALSPAVNDPGTAIEIIGSFVRLFAALVEPLDESEQREPPRKSIRVRELSLEEMLNDAFRPIARDGAAIVEVQIRLQKALAALSAFDNEALRQAARRHSRQALARAEKAIALPDDVAVVAEVAAWSA